MVIYNVQNNGQCNQLVIELINDSVYIDPARVAYVTGTINLEGKYNWVSSFKAHFLGKKYFKPKFSGTGKIYTIATLGNFHKFALQPNEELILSPYVFVACRETVNLTPRVQFSLKRFLWGAPMTSMLARGNGNIMVLTQGPVHSYTIKNDKFMAIDHDVIAYSPQLEQSRELVGKNWITGQKMVRVFRGNGEVYFNPIPNKGARSNRGNKVNKLA